MARVLINNRNLTKNVVSSLKQDMIGFLWNCCMPNSNGLETNCPYLKTYLAIFTGLQPQYSEATGTRLCKPNLWTRDTQGLVADEKIGTNSDVYILM